MKTTFFVLIATLFVVRPISIAQTIPGWQSAIELTLPSTHSVISSYANGYGQHILTSSGTIDYFLLGNDGQPIYSNPYPPFPIDTEFDVAAITGHGDILYVALQITNQIRLFTSTNGGATWYIPTTGHIVAGDVSFLDIVADLWGCHVVWTRSGLNQVEYVFYDPIDRAFRFGQTITGAGTRPKVHSTGNRIFASFVTTNLTPNVGGTREADVSTGTPNWETTIRTGPPDPLGYGFVNQDIAILGNSLHMLLWQSGAAPHEYLYGTKRTINPPGQWDGLINFGEYFIGPGSNNFRRRLASFGDTVYAGYEMEDEVASPPTSWIEYRLFAGSGWSGPENVSVEVEGLDIVQRPTLSVSLTGQYFFWSYNNNNVSRWMRRRVGAISGNLTTNHFFTGRNWVSGDTYINGGKTVWLKSNSETNILANKKLIVQNGATLIVEANATVTMESGARIVVQNGGMVKCEENAVLAIPQYGSLEAQGGSQFKFGQNAGLVINGKLSVAGSQTQPVTFDRVSPSVTSWAGIVVDNKPSGATINYANIANCGSGVALSTRTDAWLSVTNCVIDNAAIGLEIVPPQSPGEANPPVPTMMVTNNTFSNIGTTGISVDGLSTLVLQGNTITQPPPSPVEVPTYGVLLTNASPQMLGNTINGFYNGLYCINASSPILENQLWGGYNVITDCEIGVECDNSDPVLGFIHGGPMNDEGGQNSIFANSVLDVSLWGKSCTVIGENNWYGADHDPPGLFYVGEGSYLDYDPWLRENPNLYGPGANGGGERQSGVDLLLLKQVLSERVAGNDREAIRLLRSLIADEEQDSSMKEWAIRQIVAIAQTRNQTGLSEYLRNLLTTSSGLARQIKAVLPAIYATERSTSNMLDAYSANIQEYPRTHLERSGLYGKLVHAIYTAKDYDRALHLFTQLEAGYPRSSEVVVGRVQLENFQSRLLAAAVANRSNGGLMKPGEEASQGVTAPTAYRLSDSYPNPFNPSTTLSFDLPEPASVSLVVYDVLGRKIAELAEGSYGAGTHTATWNAEQQASGVYFARFVVTGSSGGVKYAKVSKLVLMK